jgi:hypothetical protein
MCQIQKNQPFHQTIFDHNTKMKKYVLRFSVFMIVLLLCDACTKDNPGLDNLYTPAASDATATATLGELQQGRTLFINNCGTCHSLYSPDSFSASNWGSILSNMVPRTGLSQSNASLVSKYVTRGKQ